MHSYWALATCQAHPRWASFPLSFLSLISGFTSFPRQSSGLWGLWRSSQQGDKANKWWNSPRGFECRPIWLKTLTFDYPSCLPGDLLVISNKFTNVQNFASRLSFRNVPHPREKWRSIFPFRSYYLIFGQYSNIPIVICTWSYCTAKPVRVGGRLFSRALIIVMLKWKLNVLLEQLKKKPNSESEVNGCASIMACFSGSQRPEKWAWCTNTCADFHLSMICNYLYFQHLSSWEGFLKIIQIHFKTQQTFGRLTRPKCSEFFLIGG